MKKDRGIVFRILTGVYDVCCVPLIYVVLVCIYKIKPFVLVTLVSGRFGHLLGSSEILLRYYEKYVADDKAIVFIGGEPCNKFYAEMLKRKYLVITNYFLRRAFFSNLIKKKFMPYTRLDFHTRHDAMRINDMPPALTFTEDDHTRGRKLLKNLKIDNGWYVCLHSRDNAYLDKQEFHKGNFGYHAYRDCDIENYFDAAKYCADQGGKVIRMGAVVGGDALLPDYITDYSRECRSDFGDVYLPAHNKFFLGSTSGLLNAAAVFNVPIAAANFVPFDAALRGDRDIFIPKKVWSEDKNRYLTFKEIFDFKFDSFFRADLYEANNLRLVENTSEEILGLAQEMNERLDGVWVETEEDKILQEKYKSLFRPEHGAYNFQSRVGAIFLRLNKHLLEDINIHNSEVCVDGK